MSDKSEVTEIIATDGYVVCPSCYEIVDGWVCNPSGSEAQCDHCDHIFTISKHADIEWR